MKTEASLLAEIAAAPTLREQTALVAELDALRNSRTAQIAQDRSWDAAGTIVEDTLRPVLTHSFHTASTDWLSEADIPSVDANRVHAEASLWFGKTSSMVKADDEEFTEQAFGVARRLASQFGEAAPEAQRLFMDYVAFLRRREAASGLDQIQQTVAPDGTTRKTTPLPEDTFDTFQDPIDPMNQGVDEMQSTENAPLLNEIIQNGQGQGQAEVPNGHSTSQTFTGPQTNGSGMSVGASLVDAPSVAQGYLYNLDDFLRAEAAIKTAARESDDDAESSPTPSSTDLSAQAGWREDVGINDELAKEGEEEREKEDDKPKAKKEAASGLDEPGQILNAHDEYDPKPLDYDVAFPLIPYFEQGGAKKESVKIASSVGEMLQQGTDNPLLNKTLDGSEKAAEEPTNAMSKAVKHGSLTKEAQAEFDKGLRFAAGWTADQPIVREGSVAFETGLYVGMTKNAAAQEAWLAAHDKWGATDEGIAKRIDRHAALTERIMAEAATTTDLDEMTPGNGLTEGPHRNAPFNGPGEVPPLAGGMDPAAPGGAAMYNGAEPFSKPVAPDPGWTNQQRQTHFSSLVRARLAEQQ